MPVPLQNTRTAMTRSAPTGYEPRWNDVQSEFFAACASTLSPELERLLLDILNFTGELQLDETSAMPHRMSPENMLKSLAVQLLGRWTGLTHLSEMQRVEMTTASLPLRSMIQAVITRAKTVKSPAHEIDVIAESDPQHAAGEATSDWSSDWSAERVQSATKVGEGFKGVITRPVGKVGGFTFIRDQNWKQLKRKSEYKFAA